MNLDEDRARSTLLAGVEKTRAKPSTRPAFPGARGGVEHKAFPGTGGTERRQSVIPKICHEWSEIDRRRFVKQAFEEIKNTFEGNLRQAVKDEPRLDIDFTPISAFDFSTEIYLDGKRKCRCRVWLANETGSDSIAFQEGNTTGNAMNEILYPSTDGEPSFSATLAMGLHDAVKKFDIKRLSSRDAAEYLWARFVQPLSY